jgi:hypothetical protein
MSSKNTLRCVTVAEPLFLKKRFHSKRSMLNRLTMQDDLRLQISLPSDVFFTAPSTQMSAWREIYSSNWFCPTLAEPLFLKNVSTANALASSDQLCMMTEGIKHSTQRCVIHFTIYTDVGMALNLIRFMVSAPSCSMRGVVFGSQVAETGSTLSYGRGGGGWL